MLIYRLLCILFLSFTTVGTTTINATIVSNSNFNHKQSVPKRLSFMEKLTLKIITKQLKKRMAVEDSCFLIILKEGQRISATVNQITPTEVKYRRCGKVNDPEIVVLKRDIYRIVDAEGEVVFQGKYDEDVEEPKPQKEIRSVIQRTNGFAVAGFILGLVGLLSVISLYGLIAAVLGIIFSLVGLGNINRDPEQFRGRGLAVAGLVLSLIGGIAYGLIIGKIFIL